jgi:hypothetical protein
MELRKIDCEDGRWIELAQDSVQWRAFVTEGVELSGSATRQVVSQMELRKIGCEDDRWMELAQDRVQWRFFLSAVLNFLVLLPES